MTDEEIAEEWTKAWGACLDDHYGRLCVFARAVAARERERCAKVCEEEDVAATDDPLGVQECIAKSIRSLVDEND